MKSNINKTFLGENELFEGYSEELLTFASAACILFIIIGIPGNLLTIIALSRGKTTRNATAIFIINLSFSDLLFGCFNLPLAASTFLRRAWEHGVLLCRLFPLLRYGLQAVSLFTISLITINRYIMIAHPRQYPRIYRHGYLALMVAGTWFAAFSILITTWYGIWGIFGLDTTIGSCSILHDKNGRSPKEFFFVAAFLLPCICIVICYARIFFTVRNAAFRIREIAEQKTETQICHNMENIVQNDNKVSPDTSSGDARKPFVIDEDIEYIDMSDQSSSSENPHEKAKIKENSTHLDTEIVRTLEPLKQEANNIQPNEKTSRRDQIKTSLKTSFNKIAARKNHYVSIGNTSNASSIYPGRMSYKDKRLLKMILIIFLTFVICYLPITVTKISRSATEIHFVNISGYLLIYLTTCINPLIYVLMSIEYRQAYRNLILCRIER